MLSLGSVAGPLNNSCVVSASSLPPQPPSKHLIRLAHPRTEHASPHVGLVTRRRPRVATLDGVLASPLPGRRLISGTIRLVHVGDLGYQRVVGVGVRQHGADGEED